MKCSVGAQAGAEYSASDTMLSKSELRDGTHREQIFRTRSGISYTQYDPSGVCKGWILLLPSVFAEYVHGLRHLVVLARHLVTAGFSVTRVDYRGHGHSLVSGFSHIDELVDDCRQVLHGRVPDAVLGFGVGGHVGARLAHSIPLENVFACEPYRPARQLTDLLERLVKVLRFGLRSGDELAAVGERSVDLLGYSIPLEFLAGLPEINGSLPTRTRLIIVDDTIRSVRQFPEATGAQTRLPLSRWLHDDWKPPVEDDADLKEFHAILVSLLVATIQSKAVPSSRSRSLNVQPEPYLDCGSGQARMSVFGDPDQELGVLFVAGAGPVGGANHHSSWVRLAERLARHSIAQTMVVDYVGAGDSSGKFSMPELRAPQSREICRAVALLRARGATRVVVVGHCYGGVSACAATRHVSIDHILAVGPPTWDEQEGEPRFVGDSGSGAATDSYENALRSADLTVLFGTFDAMRAEFERVVLPPLQASSESGRFSYQVVPGRIFGLQDTRSDRRVYQVLRRILNP